MPAKVFERTGISVCAEGRVYCSHDKLAAKRRSTTEKHPNMYFWRCTDCYCPFGGWCDCGFLWEKDLIDALEFRGDKGKELAAFVKSRPEGQQIYTPSQLIAVGHVEPPEPAQGVTMTELPLTVKKEPTSDKAVLQLLHTPPSSGPSKGKRKLDASSSQSSGRSLKRAKSNDVNTQRQLSVKNEADVDNEEKPRKQMKRLRQV